MPIFRGVKHAIGTVAGRHDREVLYECRLCGRMLDSDASLCPVCGGKEIAEFRL